MLLQSRENCLQSAFEKLKSSEEKLSVTMWEGKQISVNRALICFFSPVIRDVVKDVPRDSNPCSIILPDFQVSAIEHLLNILNSGVACFAVLKDVVEVARVLGIGLLNIEYTDERHVEKIVVKEKLDYELELSIKEEISELVIPVEGQMEGPSSKTTADEREPKKKDKVKVPPIPKIKREVSHVIQSPTEEPSTNPIEPLPVVVTDFLRGFRKTPRPLVPTLVVPELSESFLRNHLPHSLARLVITLEEKQEVYCLYEGLRHVEGKEKKVENVPDIFFPTAVKDQLKMKRRLAFLTGKWFRWGITHYGASPDGSSPPGGPISPDTTRHRKNQTRPGARHTRPVARSANRVPRHKTNSGHKTVSESSRHSYSSSRTRAPDQRRDEERRRRRRSRESSPSRSGQGRSGRTRTRSRSRLR